MSSRPAVPIQISQNVLAVAQLAGIDVTPQEFYRAIENKQQWLQWLAAHRLGQNAVNCGNCRHPMALVSRAESSDGFSWCCRPCNSCCSVRTGSFFTNCEISTEKIVMLLFYWLYEVKCKHVMFFEGITSWDTIVTYNNYFRQECYNWLLNNQAHLGGFDANGQSVFVEADESYFFHRKYHRGQRRRGQWVVGLVKHGSGHCWVEVVARCDAPTLERIISDHVLPGTTIVTDAWQGYNNVGQLINGIHQHEMIVHEQEFVNSVHAQIHTETVEGLWMQAK